MPEVNKILSTPIQWSKSKKCGNGTSKRYLVIRDLPCFSIVYFMFNNTWNHWIYVHNLNLNPSALILFIHFLHRCSFSFLIYVYSENTLLSFNHVLYIHDFFPFSYMLGMRSNEVKVDRLWPFWLLLYTLLFLFKRLVLFRFWSCLI